MGFRTNGISDQWDFGLMGFRTNGISDQWDFGIMRCPPYLHVVMSLGYQRLFYDLFTNRSD